MLVLFSFPAFAGSHLDNEYKSSLTQKDLVAKILKLKKEKKSGSFIRINKNILKFEGYINRETYPEYLKNIDNDVKMLVINCLGGDTYSGVKMGIDIQKRKLKIIVEGLAVSSGANYLFLAGKEKIIKNGFVGFHGNTQAAINKNSLDDVKKEMEEQFKKTNKHFDTDENMQEALNKSWETFKKEQAEAIDLEKEFYGTNGVSQQLFDITQTEGKGLLPELQEKFDFLAPSPSTMKKFNIQNVSGEQNIPLAEAVGIKVIYW
jgi:ATP-dependent protease ClpP protease subunit